MSEPIDIAAIFSPHNTLPDSLPADPWPLFRAWFDDAVANKVTPNPNAFTLACLDEGGALTARIVLCKKILDQGAIVFHTNYNSRKGRGLTKHPRAAAVFHWDALEKQVRIEGPVVKSPAEESDAYFKTRGWENRLGAWASDQSQPIASREELLFQIAGVMEKLGISIKDIMDKGDAVEIPRPPHWGGWRLWAERVELWLGGPGRVHDRAEWTRTIEPSDIPAEFRCGKWKSTRLQP
ncbi:MAG: pyridoxamine 5'-phosphate oxidase [Phycisphaeraceae bacterium]|nr:pyridoxamine 5'-phosphate oxidase [Phycisphaeraceae bacterium]